MTTSSGKTALITGASGGIGSELAKLFARDGYNLVLVARNRQALEEVSGELNAAYGTSALVMPKDLADPAAPEEIYAELAQSSTVVDALVNNAGFGLFGYFIETDYSREQQMIQVNVVTLTRLTKLFLPGFVERKSGKLLNIASTAAFQPGPLMAVYYASKAYVLYFSEALASELKGTGVTVTALCPGPTRTGFQASAQTSDSWLFRRGLMEASEVAQAGYSGMMKGKTVVVPGWFNKLTALSPRFAPRDLTTRIVRAVHLQGGESPH